MERRARQSLAAPLVEVRRQFERWRASRGRRGRIPEKLWDAAVALAMIHDPAEVARALKLRPDSLNRRLEACPVGGPGRPATSMFVEVGLCPPEALTECVVEMEDPCGGRMRIHLKGPSASVDLAAVSGFFWRRG